MVNKRKMPEKRIIIAILCTAIVAGFLAVGISKIIVNRNTNTQAADHDETNSDGHHSETSESLGEQIDLTSQAEVSIDIKDFKYEKPNIKVKRGTTITWTNRDSIEHNVMLEHENSDDAHDAPSAGDVDPNTLAGPMLKQGENYSYTFDEVSESPYHCSPHPYMKGNVTVVE